jgi:hypothetical protein
VRRVRGGCPLYSGFLLSFDVVEQLADCALAGLKGVMIISGRRSVLLFFSKVNGGTDERMNDSSRNTLLLRLLPLNTVILWPREREVGC